ncbi:MAG: DUF2911 domain-containing protein [Cyclobacteriaceae bacterium]
MIRILPLIVLVTFASCKNGESLFSKNKNNRPSPPAKLAGKIDGTEIIINYSSPRVNDRTIWGDLVPYNRLWRTGANEATNIYIGKDVLINGKPLPKGKYSLFTIPGENVWTVIFNKNWDLWGSYDYSENKDALRIQVSPYTLDQNKENLAFELKNNMITFKWEKKAFDLLVQSPEN